MKTKAICSFFVLFAIVAVMVSTTPAAFADHSEVTIATADDSGTNLDCGSDCYTPSTVTVDVGGKVIFTNNVGIHTYTAGTWASGGAPSPSGEFDEFLNAEESAEWIADVDPGEYPYYCALHMWMAGTIIVQEAEAEEETMMEETMEEETMMEDELMVDIVTGTAETGKKLSIDVTFTKASGDSIEHVNYDIKATQNGEVILNEMNVHDHDGVMNHMTSALSGVASDETPVEVEVMFNGYGIPGEGDFTGPIGQVSTTQVVPEFGTIAMMILAVAIISIVAVTAKSRVIPRF